MDRFDRFSRKVVREVRVSTRRTPASTSGVDVVDVLYVDADGDPGKHRFTCEHGTVEAALRSFNFVREGN
jgi:hypothetical protein